MRISDWSSDVCSSDLEQVGDDPALVITKRKDRGLGRYRRAAEQPRLQLRAGRRIGLRVVEQCQPVLLLRLAGQGQMTDGPRVDFLPAIEIADARDEIAERENAADIEVGQIGRARLNSSH